MKRTTKRFVWLILRHFREINYDEFVADPCFYPHDFVFVNRYDMTEQDKRRIYCCLEIMNEGLTVRQVQAKYRISKSGFHRWVHKKLPDFSPELYAVMQKVLECHKYEGQIKGGKVCQFRKKVEKEANK